MATRNNGGTGSSNSTSSSLGSTPACSLAQAITFAATMLSWSRALRPLATNVFARPVWLLFRCSNAAHLTSSILLLQLVSDTERLIGTPKFTAMMLLSSFAGIIQHYCCSWLSLPISPHWHLLTAYVAYMAHVPVSGGIQIGGFKIYGQRVLAQLLALHALFAGAAGVKRAMLTSFLVPYVLASIATPIVTNALMYWLPLSQLWPFDDSRAFPTIMDYLKKRRRLQDMASFNDHTGQTLPPEETIVQVMALGFGRAECIEALQDNDNDPQRAINFLLDQS